MKNSYLFRNPQLILFLVGVFGAVLGLVFKEISFIYAASLTFVFANMLFSLKKIRYRIVFFVFQLTITLFIIMRPVILIIEGNLYYRFSQGIMWESSLIAMVSLFSMSLVAILPIKWESDRSSKLRNARIDYFAIRKITQGLYYISYIALLVVIVEKISFTQTHTITDYYNSFVSMIPLVVTKLADSNMIIFYIFLGTFPTKKESRVIVCLHIIASALTLAYGVRNIFVLNVVALLIYYVLCCKNESEKKSSINKKNWLKLLFLSPLGIMGLQLIENLRKGLPLVSYTLFRDFLFSQGGSSEVISYTLYYYKEIPKQVHPYSIGSIFNYANQNIVSRFIFGNTFYAQNTVEMAMYGHHLGSSIAYLDYPITYLQGVGMGSSFLAELYFDFSFIGVIIGTVILTIILLKIINILWYNPYVFGIVFIMIRWIIYTPRDTFTNWLVQGLSIMNLFIIGLIFILSKLLRTQIKKEM